MQKHQTINPSIQEMVTASLLIQQVNNEEAVPHLSHSTPMLEEVEALTNEIKRLLVRYETTLEHEGLRHQIETLERWMESYRRGLSAAKKLSENGANWLAEFRDKMKLAADELVRLESEGGMPATSQQALQAEELLKATRRIDKILPEVEHLFMPPCEGNNAETNISDATTNN